MEQGMGAAGSTPGKVACQDQHWPKDREMESQVALGPVFQQSSVLSPFLPLFPEGKRSLNHIIISGDR